MCEDGLIPANIEIENPVCEGLIDKVAGKYVTECDAEKGIDFSGKFCISENKKTCPYINAGKC